MTDTTIERDSAAGAPLRIGLLGASRIAQTTIIGTAKERADVVVTAVAARDQGRAAEYATQHGIANVASSYDALLARPDVDLVYIGLPPTEHAVWSVAAAEAGKAVLCEKIFATNAEQARVMVAMAQRAGRPLMEAMVYRFHPMLVRAFDIVTSGRLGKVKSASATANVRIPQYPGAIVWNSELAGGALMELGCFPAHALRTMLDAEPTVVSASRVMKDGVDASTKASLVFPGDVPATLETSVDADAPSINLIVEGEHGRMEINNYVLPQQGYRFQVRSNDLTIDEMAPVASPYGAQLAHVVEVMAGRIAPLTGGADAIANMVLIDAIRAASATN